jgi:hypothetical protein
VPEHLLQMEHAAAAPQVVHGKCVSPISCVFGKPALSRILGLFPGGFAATTSG